MPKSGLTLHPIDWVVLAAYFVGMLLVGVYYSRRNKSADDYLLGGRKMSSWRVGLSYFATIFSAVTYLSLPGEMVKNGPMMWSCLAAFPFVYLIVSRFFVPFIMKLRISSAYELLEVRLGRKNRILASVYFLLMRFVWMGVIIYMCADKVIVPIMGWPEEKALLVSVAMGVVTIIYSSIGGLKSVVITDVIQTFVLFGGCLVAIGAVVHRLGGVSALIPAEWPEHWAGWAFFDPKARVSFLTAFLSVFTWHVCTAGSDQMAIQRYLATRDAKAAGRMFKSSMISTFLIHVLLAVLGLAVLAYFVKFPAQLPAGQSLTAAADSLFPRFIVIGMPVGFPGMVLAGLMAAAMSSLASGINSSCLVIIKDFILPCRKNLMNDKNQVILAKAVSVSIGVLVVLLSLVINQIKGNLLEIAYKTINLLTGPLFVPFFLAMFVRRAKPAAAFIATIAAGLTAFFIGFSGDLFAIEISFLWIIPASFAVGALVGVVLSYAARAKSDAPA